MAIVGVGLIGGSIGLALRQRRLARRVVGIGRDEARLQAARDRGAVDAVTTNLGCGLQGVDLVVICTPVDRIVDHARSIAPFCPAGAILTDVGSTKRSIVSALGSPDAPLPAGVSFVCSHPLAGSEKTGVAHARADLFEDRICVVTPQTVPGAGQAPPPVQAVCAFWRDLGAEVRVMSPESHDEMIAYTSHLPHLLAAALCRVLPEGSRDFAASGFRDTTRIAASDAELWAAILHDNRGPLGAALARLERELAEWKRILAADSRDGEARHALARRWNEARAARLALDTGFGD